MGIKIITEIHEDKFARIFKEDDKASLFENRKNMYNSGIITTKRELIEKVTQLLENITFPE
jgi:hypothetical protein